MQIFMDKKSFCVWHPQWFQKKKKTVEKDGVQINDKTFGVKFTDESGKQKVIWMYFAILFLL